jgi:hypothetical protein
MVCVRDDSGSTRGGIKAGPNVMGARVEPTLRMKVHGPVRLAPTPKRLPFFDPKTQLSI